MELLEFIFWLSLFLLIYPYVIYPVVLIGLSKLFGANHHLVDELKEEPTITFIISAYNEEEVIGEKLQNAMELDYPQDKLEILVVSDACSDRTDDIVREWTAKNPNIKLVRQEQRRGKSCGLNLAVERATGEVIVFSDANAIYKKDALRELIRYFDNPDIGYVIGAALYNADRDSAATESESLYWKFELFIKEWESKFYSVVGGDGAIYAIRRNLYWKLEEDDINDFVNPLQIVAKGYKGLINQRAICYEDAAGDFRKEFRRKRRIVNRSWRALKKYFGWFDVLGQMRFMFELFSHKVIRWFSLLILIILFLSNVLILMIAPGPFYTAALAGQLLLALLAAVGYAMTGNGMSVPRIFYLPYYYLMVNTAALLGIIDDARGIRYTVWEHVRK